MQLCATTAGPPSGSVAMLCVADERNRAGGALVVALKAVQHAVRIRRTATRAAPRSMKATRNFRGTEGSWATMRSNLATRALHKGFNIVRLH
jgi:hypothetical protein